MAASNLRRAVDSADVDVLKVLMFMLGKNGSMKTSHLWMEL